MILKARSKEWVIDIICLVFILLFVYAAISKLLDYEQFRIQIGQSPMFSAFADWVAWSVPVVEILISFLLMFPATHLVGLYASFSLMVMFTTYIFIILNFADYVPCSCGGVLEELGWTEHLLFNCLFIVLALVAIYIQPKWPEKTADSYET